jgi:DNA-binding Lrp family transcriptional regulator
MKKMSKQITAYILVNSKVGMEYDIIRSIEGIRKILPKNSSMEAHPLFGEYDLIVILKTKNIQDVDRVVTELRRLEGVVKTVTLIAV